MHSETPAEQTGPEMWSSTHLVHAAIHFLRVLRYRKHILIACLVVALLLGTVYLFTAPRIYKAEASLLVLQTGSDVWSTSMTPEGMRQGMLPTYERLFSSAVVLEGALQQLQELPRELLVDLASIPQDRWVEELRENLKASSIRLTNLIEISYRSQKPEAAEAIVGAVVRSYLDFMERSHKDVATEIATILQRERVEVERRWMDKNRELLEAKRRVRDLGLREDSSVLHPVVHRVVQINEALLDVRQRRVQLESTLAAIRGASQRGGDLRHHLLSVEPIVGRELVLAALGLSDKDGQLVMDFEKKLMEDQAQLQTLDAHYGPAHPRVQELTAAIRQTEQFLAGHDQAVEQRLAKVEGGRLGRMLTGMVEEELAKTWTHERELEQQYARSEEEAVQLNGQIAEVAIMEHEVQLLQNLHGTLMNRIDNIEIREDQADVRVAVVSEPTADDRPVSPRLLLVVAVCLLGGLGSGTVLVYVRDILDDHFRSPEELKQQLNVPVLAMVRQLPPSDATGPHALQVHLAPDSVESEAFRTLRTTLAFSGQEAECVVVSSSEPGDGKTTVLANLGAASAQAGKKTLLIDGDMRRPGLSKLFGLRGTEGLSDVLKSGDDIAGLCMEKIRPTGIEGLDVLPCGRRPSDPTALLSDPRLADLLAWAENVYDWLLIDSPPLLAASDASIIGRLCGGLVLVVQPQKNHRRLVVRAVESVTAVGLNLMGVVVNRIDSEKGHGYYGGYGYGYGYGYGSGYAAEETADDPDVIPLMPEVDVTAEADFQDEQFDLSHSQDDGVVPRRAA